MTALVQIGIAIVIGVALLPTIFEPSISPSGVMDGQILWEAVIWLIAEFACTGMILRVVPTVIDNVDRAITPIHTLASRSRLAKNEGQLPPPRAIAIWLIVVLYVGLAELLLRNALVATIEPFVAPPTMDGLIAVTFLALLLASLVVLVKVASPFLSATTLYLLDSVFATSETSVAAQDDITIGQSRPRFASATNAQQPRLPRDSATVVSNQMSSPATVVKQSRAQAARIVDSRLDDTDPLPTGPTNPINVETQVRPMAKPEDDPLPDQTKVDPGAAQ